VAHRHLDNGLLDRRRGFDWGAELVKHCQSRSIMIADVAGSIAAHTADRGDPSIAVRREEERDPIIERVAQYLSTYAGRSKLIEFLWIEKRLNALKQVDFTYKKELSQTHQSGIYQYRTNKSQQIEFRANISRRD
jgi:hypothetical protein